MAIKIIIDSSCDYTRLFSEKIKIEVAPLLIDLDQTTYVDDDKLNMKSFLTHMRNMHGFKTACPSIHTYEELYAGDEDILVMTISSNLSASYQSAVAAMNQYFEHNGIHKKIHVFNSKTASAGQVSILVKMIECCEEDMPFDEIVDVVEDFISKNKTVFMLQSLGNLAKAGRVSPLIAATTAVLNIRCVMFANEEGKIELMHKIVGEKRCIKTLAGVVAKFGEEFKNRTLCISHCEGMDKAEAFLKELSTVIDMKKFKDVLIQNTTGLASLYADFGGIVIGL